MYGCIFRYMLRNHVSASNVCDAEHTWCFSRRHRLRIQLLHRYFRNSYFCISDLVRSHAQKRKSTHSRRTDRDSCILQWLHLGNRTRQLALRYPHPRTDHFLPHCCQWAWHRQLSLWRLLVQRNSRHQEYHAAYAGIATHNLLKSMHSLRQKQCSI